MKKRIAFLVPSIINCGPLNVVLNLVANLDKDKFDIMLISLRKSIDEDSSYINLFLKECVLGIKYLNERPETLVSLSHELDIIHSHGFYPDKLVASLKNQEVKKITTVHCMLFKDYIQEYGFLKGTLGALLHIFYLRKNKFSYIVSCSHTVERYLSKYVDDKKLISVNNGVNQEIFIPIDFEEKAFRKKQHDLAGKRVFIFAGRMIRRKQVPELISFFIKFLGEDKGNILLLLGDGEEIQKCKELATDQVKFLGMVNNPAYYYQMSDFVVSMSNAEGYPMSILEAVSCGCYALLSDIPSHREFIDLNPSCANYINSFSQSKISEIYNMNTHELSAKLMAERYVKIYLR